MDRFSDSEARQTRAMLAMEAVECLLEGQAEHDTMQTEQLGALIGLVFDAVREALPKAAMMGSGANDLDD